MINWFRRVSGALQAISKALERIIEVLERDLMARTGDAELEGRIDSIERNLERWEAKVEAELLRAESKFKQARAAEERTRHAAKALEGDEEGEEDLFEQYRDLVQEGDASGSQNGGMQPVRAGVESNLTEKQALRAQKFGL